MKYLLIVILLMPLCLLAQSKEQPRPKVLGAIAKPDQTNDNPATVVIRGIPVQVSITIKAEEAKNHIGEPLTVCDVVMDGRFLESSATQPTLLNLGAAFPNQHLTIFISKEVRASFDIKPEEQFKGKKVCVTGKITEYRGKPQIVLARKEDMKLE